MKKGFLYLKKGTNTARKNIVYATKDYNTTLKGDQIIGYGLDENGLIDLEYTINEKDLKNYRKCPLFQTRYYTFGNYFLAQFKKNLILKQGKKFNYLKKVYIFKTLSIIYKEKKGYAIFNDEDYNFKHSTISTLSPNDSILFGMFNEKKCLDFKAQLIFNNGKLMLDKSYYNFPAKIVITHDLLNEKTNVLLETLKNL